MGLVQEKILLILPYQHFPNSIASNAIRTYNPHSACLKYAALGSVSNSALISLQRGNGCRTIILVLAHAIISGFTE